MFDILGKERDVFSVRRNGHTITITERGRVRTLKCDGLIYSRIERGSLYTHEYWDFFLPLAYLYKKPRMLMIGLGGGTIAFQLSKLFGSRLSLEIVELDKQMAEIYPRFLGGDVGYRITIAEGAEYVSRHRDEYDIVILDAYEPGGSIPEHFRQSPFIEDAYASLKEKGVFAVNCIGSMLGPSMDSFVQNLSERFEVYRLDTAYYTANVILVCSKGISKDELLERMHENMREDGKNGFLIRAYESSRRVFITL